MPGFPVHHQLLEPTHSCPSHQWCHPTISSSVVPFSSHLQSFPASGSFPLSQLFASGGQSIGASASASVLPMNIQDWFPLWRLVGSPCSPGDSQESSPTPQFKSTNSLALSFLYSPTLTWIHDAGGENRKYNHKDDNGLDYLRAYRPLNRISVRFSSQMNIGRSDGVLVLRS